MLASLRRSTQLRLNPETGKSSKLMTTSLKTVIAATTLFAGVQFAHAAKLDAQITAAQAEANGEDIELIAATSKKYGDKFGSGEIKLSNKNIKTLAKFMAGASLTKSTTALPQNRLDNKADEIGEAAAVLASAISSAPKITNTLTAKNAFLNILKGALTDVKKATDLTTVSGLMRSIAGGVALTIHNNPAYDAKEAKYAKFLIQKSKTIAGKTNKDQIKIGLQEGFAGTADAILKYEDGTQYATLMLITDPETDFRNG